MGKEKRVVFVAGTEFSGSTFFHMILANDPRGLAVGEVHNYMRPTKPWHFDMHCGCGNSPCTVWQNVKRSGERQAYTTLFEQFPEVDFIVDSSKNPFWIRMQSEILDAQNIRSDHILMWKTPLEFAKSYHKRGNEAQWERSWVVYHRLYRTLFDNWPSVKYGEFARRREVLRATCARLDIPYFAGKEEYWGKEQHVIGGNPSARIHLYDQESRHFQENVQRSTSEIDVAHSGTHKMIYYEDQDLPDGLEARVNERIHENPYLNPILNMLNRRDLFAAGQTEPIDESALAMPQYALKLRQLRHYLSRGLAGLRYG